ncbi:hypothetical protein KUCAC02_016098, partial [Chaenocephalus aceratus]
FCLETWRETKRESNWTCRHRTEVSGSCTQRYRDVQVCFGAAVAGQQGDGGRAVERVVPVQ